MTDVVQMVSPCIGQCGLVNGLCKGCKRTRSELRNWRAQDVNDRMRLMKELQGQVSTHTCNGCGGPAYCAMEDGKSANLCWCMEVPVKDLGTPVSSDTCLCRNCLVKVPSSAA